MNGPVEQRKALLLTDEADQLLAELMVENAGEPEVGQWFSEQRFLLDRCREVGVVENIPPLRERFMLEDTPATVSAAQRQREIILERSFQGREPLPSTEIIAEQREQLLTTARQLWRVLDQVTPW